MCINDGLCSLDSNSSANTGARTYTVTKLIFVVLTFHRMSESASTKTYCGCQNNKKIVKNFPRTADNVYRMTENSVLSKNESSGGCSKFPVNNALILFSIMEINRRRG